MPIKGQLLSVKYSDDVCSTNTHWPTPSNALIGQGDGDYELVPDIIFDDFLRERIKKVYFCIKPSKLLEMSYTL